MSDDLILHRGDTRPYLEVTCTDGGVPVDLSNATTVRVLAKPSVAGLPLISRPVADRPTDGKVTMRWQSGDTDVVCWMKVEVEVIWPDDSKQTFPAAGTVQVYPDLG